MPLVRTCACPCPCTRTRSVMLIGVGVVLVHVLQVHAERTCPLLPPSSISCIQDGGVDPTRRRYCRTTRNGHVFHASYDSPIARTLPNEATSQVEYFHRALTNLTKMAREQIGARQCSADEWTVENTKRNHIHTQLQKEWVGAIIARVYSSNLTMPASQCFSQVLLPIDDFKAIRLFSALESLMKTMSVGAVKLKRYMQMHHESQLSRIMDCSDELYINMDKPVVNDAYHCRLLAVAGIRRNSTFAIPLSYTASHTNLHRRQRRFVLENIVAKSGEDNLHSSVTMSNIAILIFPALLNMIPISCVELVTLKTLAVYIFFSDFLTVLPLAIKGIDLMFYATRTHTSCAAYTVGAEGSENELAAIELWCAQCGVHERFDTIGKIMLSIAIASLALGIAIELHAYKSLRNTIKRIRELGSERHKWWQRPAIVQYANKRCPPCENCSCDSGGLSQRSFSSSLLILNLNFGSDDISLFCSLETC